MYATSSDLETHYETVHTLKTKKRQAEGELKELATIACDCGKVFVDEEDYKVSGKDFTVVNVVVQKVKDYFTILSLIFIKELGTVLKKLK